MTEIDWSVLDLSEVVEVASQAAYKVAGKYESIHDYEDLKQEALVLLARNGEKTRKYLDDKNVGGLHHDLWADLVNLVETDSKHKKTQYSYERSREGVE